MVVNSYIERISLLRDLGEEVVNFSCFSTQVAEVFHYLIASQS